MDEHGHLVQKGRADYDTQLHGIDLSVVKIEFKEGDAENMHDEDDYSCKVEEDVIHKELILNENPVILL